ncbi:MAG: type II toxin-antitoxin system HicB family antitoxin [Phycisphaerales bacterium]|nr:type II toxin-antitoxin system HicB family antitoxin [Phycisphaerales bacterium]
MQKRKSKSGAKQAVDRPFDPALLRRAHALVDDYSFVCGRDPDGGFLCQWLEFPGVLGVGDSPQAAIKLARELLHTTIACELERGTTLPAPAAEGRRTEQVNIRLSSLEKLRLETNASKGGFRSVSDYIRAAALDRSA